jgi:hypothetical protein
MHRPSIDLRPFARLNNRRAPAPHRKTLGLRNPVRAATIGASIQRNLRWARFRLSVSKAIRPTSPRWSSAIPPLLADCHTPM